MIDLTLASCPGTCTGGCQDQLGCLCSRLSACAGPCSRRCKKNVALPSSECPYPRSVSPGCSACQGDHKWAKNPAGQQYVDAQCTCELAWPGWITVLPRIQEDSS
eukprot:637173-Pelagomonas_calceolata.AAC.4